MQTVLGIDLANYPIQRFCEKFSASFLGSFLPYITMHRMKLRNTREKEYLSYMFLFSSIYRKKLRNSCEKEYIDVYDEINKFM